MTPELKQKIREHAAWGHFTSPEDRVRFFALALCGEAGELANFIKKDWRGDTGDRSADIVKELADVANYTFILAMALDVDLEKAMLDKFIEVDARPARQFLR